MPSEERRTKILVLGVVADEISTLSGLLGHECKNLFLRLDILERVGLVHEGIHVTHDLDERIDTFIAVLLSEYNLDTCDPKVKIR